MNEHGVLNFTFSREPAITIKISTCKALIFSYIRTIPYGTNFGLPNRLNSGLSTILPVI